MYRIEADTFVLDLYPEIHEEDFAYPVNVSLGMKVSSYGYSADTFMDVGVQGIADFALQLKNLYETLTGEARLEEPYSVHNYIEFIARTGGHIRVMGRLNNKSAFGYTQEINFENEIDQTYLREFVNQLLADFGKYAG
jgi:hypothetical protein